MAQTNTLTIQLPLESINRLHVLAQQTANSMAYIATKAVEQYLDLNDWQTQAIQNAVKEADSPNATFFEHDEVVARFKSTGN